MIYYFLVVKGIIRDLHRFYCNDDSSPYTIPRGRILSTLKQCCWISILSSRSWIFCLIGHIPFSKFYHTCWSSITGPVRADVRSHDFKLHVELSFWNSKNHHRMLFLQSFEKHPRRQLLSYNGMSAIWDRREAVLTKE